MSTEEEAADLSSAIELAASWHGHAWVASGNAPYHCLFCGVM